MFKKNYEIVRVKIKCRDHSRIPASKSFEVQCVLFQIIFVVEGPASVVNLEDGGNNLHPPHPDPDNNDDDQDLEEGAQKKNDIMDTRNLSTPTTGQALLEDPALTLVLPC
jgi:hypothetical protein